MKSVNLSSVFAMLNILVSSVFRIIGSGTSGVLGDAEFFTFSDCELVSPRWSIKISLEGA
jgi:hypothetical protein